MAEFGGGFDPVEFRVRAEKAERELDLNDAEVRRRKASRGVARPRFALLRRIVRLIRGGGD